MGEALHGQRVEHRPGQRGVLQSGFQRFALRPQRGVGRIGAFGRARRMAGLARCGLFGHRGATTTAALGHPALLRFLADPADHLRDVVPADPTGESTGVLVAQHAAL